MPGFSDLFETIMSCGVEIAGQGAIHGGKGILLAGARKIGWASKGSAGRLGHRLAGHSLASRSLGSGFGRVATGGRGPYDPKNEYNSRTMNAYHQSMKSGSGVIPFSGPQKRIPTHLHGRTCFDAPHSPLGRYNSRWTKNTSQQSFSGSLRTPRQNIKF